MECLTLDDYLSGESLWGRIQGISPMPFIEAIEPIHLDMNLILNHGNKYVFSKIPSLGLDYVAKDAVFLYKQKWLDLIAIGSLNLEIGADKTHKISETITHAETRVNKQDSINKVSAFNTDELITNDGNNSNNSDDIDYSKTKVLTDSNLSYKDAFNNLSLKHRNIIINTVNSDLASLLTLDIY